MTKGEGHFIEYISATVRLNKAVKEQAKKQEAEKDISKSKFKGARTQENSKEGGR